MSKRIYRDTFILSMIWALGMRFVINGNFISVIVMIIATMWAFFKFETNYTIYHKPEDLFKAIGMFGITHTTYSFSLVSVLFDTSIEEFLRGLTITSIVGYFIIFCYSAMSIYAMIKDYNQRKRDDISTSFGIHEYEF